MRSSIQFVKEVQGTMAIEGLELKEHEVDLLHRCALGKLKIEDIVKNLVIKYTQK